MVWDYPDLPGAAALAYANDVGDAELSYAHRTTTNALLGQSLLVDEIRLRAGLPISASPALSPSAHRRESRAMRRSAPSPARRVHSSMQRNCHGWELPPSKLMSASHTTRRP
jgi:hypothetical protein